MCVYVCFMYVYVFMSVYVYVYRLYRPIVECMIHCVYVYVCIKYNGDSRVGSKLNR